MHKVSVTASQLSVQLNRLSVFKPGCFPHLLWTNIVYISINIFLITELFHFCNRSFCFIPELSRTVFVRLFVFAALIAHITQKVFFIMLLLT